MGGGRQRAWQRNTGLRVRARVVGPAPGWSADERQPRMAQSGAVRTVEIGAGGRQDRGSVLDERGSGFRGSMSEGFGTWDSGREHRFAIGSGSPEPEPRGAS